MPVVSVLMPVYNADRFLQEAIQSVIDQTFCDWELLIVDDCSTDQSFSIAQQFAKQDNRIRIFQLEKNSGSAQKPRLYAEEKACGMFVCSLDADDKLDSRYLEEMLKRQKETNADAVICRMWTFSEDSVIGEKMNPASDFDMSRILSGKEAYMLTIGEWTINAQGLLLLLLLARKAHEVFQVPDKIINADELLTRQRFLCCKKVALCEAKYYYRSNSQSITKKFSTKHFGYNDTAKAMVDITIKYFGNIGVEYEKTEAQYWDYVRRSLRLYVNHYDEIPAADRNAILSDIKKHWRQIDGKAISKFNKKAYASYILGVNGMLNYYKARKICKKLLGKNKNIAQ